MEIFVSCFSVSVWFLYGMRVFACLLEDNVCSISVVISLLLVSQYVKLDIVG